jgi:hypothetical protein
MSSLKIKIFACVCVFLYIFVYLAEKDEKEWRRIETPLRGNYVVGLKLDPAALNGDLAMLSSPALAAREVGSEGSKRAQAYIAKRFAQIGLQHFGAGYAMPFAFTHTKPLGLLMPGRPFRSTFPSAVNLLGYLRGSKYPERYMVISARYDTHLEPGISAPDQWKGNETGVAAMLAMAGYLKQHPPHNTIVFAAFDGEELGQAGARAFLAAPPFSKELIALNLNLDIVDSPRSHDFYIAGTHHTPALARPLDLAVHWSDKRILAGHDRPSHLAGRVADWTGVSDHGVFHAEGIPFLFASIDEDRTVRPVAGQADPAPRYIDKTANFLTTLAIKLDQNLDTLPDRRH